METPWTEQKGKAVQNYEADGDVSEALKRLDADPGLTCMIQLAALDSVVSLSQGAEPGTYRALLCTNGEVKANDTVTGLQLAAILLPLIRKNERLLQLQGALMAAEAEKFLKELSASE